MGTTVVWALVAALATVAGIAGWRLLRLLNGRLSAGRGVGSAVHLVMALGMALMAVPTGMVPDSVLRTGFGALGVVLAVGSFVPAARGAAWYGGHGLHHAAMCGVMVLMAAAPARGGADAATMAPGMVMSQGAGALAELGGGGSAPPPLLLAAFGYACVLAFVFAWRMPGRTADPLGHACEITMLTSTVVMLLPMV